MSANKHHLTPGKAVDTIIVGLQPYVEFTCATDGSKIRGRLSDSDDAHLATRFLMNRVIVPGEELPIFQEIARRIDLEDRVLKDKKCSQVARRGASIRRMFMELIAQEVFEQQERTAVLKNLDNNAMWTEVVYEDDDEGDEE